MESNKRYLIVGTIAVIMIAVIGVTYAYWRGMIRGSGSNMSVTLDKVYIQFTDSTEISETGVRPGWSTSKTFTVENQGSTDFKYDIYIKDLINTLATEGYFQYKITSDNNGYNMEDYAPIAKSLEASDFDLGIGITIGSGVTQTYTISFRYVNDPDVDQSEDMGKRFGGQLMIRENKGPTLYSILTDRDKYEQWTRTSTSTYNEESKTDVGFNQVLGGTTITQGYNSTGKIYKVETSSSQIDYYFAGNPSDNWVLFAGLWWRIIRTNSSEGTRLLYAGTTHDGQDGRLSTSSWSTNADTPSCLYYTNATHSSILENWYISNIIGNNDKMVNSIVYCNDISESSIIGNDIFYGASVRLYNNKTPSYKCNNANGFGNVAKVGMMTADEVAYAGGVYNQKTPNTYYYRNSKTSGCTEISRDPCSVTGGDSWWTMSPRSYVKSGNSGSAEVFYVGVGENYAGKLGSNYVYVSLNIRPVVTLKPNIKVTGSGTTDDPFVPSL